MASLSGMTGFARMEGVSGEWRWAWEARSVNGKGLEARFRLPTGFDRLVSPSTVLGLAEGEEGGSQWRECGGDALLSPDSVFEMDLHRWCESAPGEGALPWAPSQRTPPCA